MKKRLYIITAFGALLLLAAVFVSTFRGWGGGLTNGLLVGAAAIWVVVVAFSWKGITQYLAKRSTRYGLNALILSFVVLVILFMLSFLADQHAIRKDFTATGEFSLSEKSLNVLEGISRPIDIYVYYDPAQREAVNDLLTEYTRRNRQLRVHMEDLNKDPELAERFEVRELGTIVFDAGDKAVRLNTFGEEDVTNALIKVSRPGTKKVYFLTGHGEKDIEDKGVNGFSILSAALSRENYEARALSLTEEREIPEDCDILVVAGAKSRLLDHERMALTFFLQAGGRLLFLLDPRFETGLERLCAEWGIAVGPDRVIDPSPTGSLVGKGPTTPLVARYGVHDITKQFRQPTFFPLVRSVSRQKLYQGSAETASLAFSSEQSWADRDVRGREVSFDAEDLPGPVSLAMASRMDVRGKHFELEPGIHQVPGGDLRSSEALTEAGKATEGEARLVVFGDSDFVANVNFNDMGNGNLLLNAVAWLAEDEELIAVRPKPADRRTITINSAQMKMLNILAIGVLPALIAGLGLAVTLRRRATS